MNRMPGLLRSGLTQTDFDPIEVMIHPDAAVAMDFWRDRPADGIRIGRDVPSRKIARLLSRVVVCEPADDGDDYRVRLAGGWFEQRFGRDISGERVSEIFDDPTECKARLGAMNAALKSGEPRMARVVHHRGCVELMRHEVVVLPVTAPNGKDRWALVFAFYF